MYNITHTCRPTNGIDLVAFSSLMLQEMFPLTKNYANVKRLDLEKKQFKPNPP